MHNGLTQLMVYFPMRSPVADPGAPLPVKLVKKMMASTPRHKFRESSGPNSCKLLDPLLMEYCKILDVNTISFNPQGDKRLERCNQELLSHSFVCLPLPYMEGIVLICNIGLYCVIALFNGTGNVFNR